ncbi:MAG TPA: serine hydrolase domain-containing protein [Bryobacteraceae bacterium]|nr:serine hydrolase domain-containing protein [Bryobacteraceae bacterium]
MKSLSAAGLVASAIPHRAWGATSGNITDTLRASLAQHKIPCCVAMACTVDKITYTAAFGKRDSASGIDVNPESIFGIASMTKPVTSVAAMQLVEQGKLKLDEPAGTYIPELGKLQVLHGFDAAGKPILKPATKPVTLRTLLTHTSGFAYDTWFADMVRWEKATNTSIPLGTVAPVTPLMFEPGSRWQYGTSADWSGRLVETVSGMTLEQYFQKNILQPLGMKDTSFIMQPKKYDRAVSLYRRDASGKLIEQPRAVPPPPKADNGGGGLSGTAPDYVKFMQMFLRKGKSASGAVILQPKTVDMMATNQIGDIGAGKLKTARPDISYDLDFHPGVKDGFGFGFLINSKPYDHGRSAGSLAWAGAMNTYFWIDPQKGMAGVIMMQFFPFADPEAIAVLRGFEHAVYA